MVGKLSDLTSEITVLLHLSFFCISSMEVLQITSKFTSIVQRTKLSATHGAYISTPRVSKRRKRPSEDIYITVLVPMQWWSCIPSLDRGTRCFCYKYHRGKGAHRLTLTTTVLTATLFNCKYQRVPLKPAFLLTDAVFPTRRHTVFQLWKKNLKDQIQWLF